MDNNGRDNIIGNNIKRLRFRHKLTLKALAEKTGFSVSQINKYESGQNIPGGKNLNKLADAFNCGIGDLTRDGAEFGSAEEEHQGYQKEFNEREAIFHRAKEETKEMSDAEFYKVMAAIFGVIEDMKKKGGQ